MVLQLVPASRLGTTRAAASGLTSREPVERVVEVEVPVTVVKEVDVEMLPKGSSWAKALTQLAEQLDRGLVYDRTATWQTSRSHWKQPPKR